MVETYGVRELSKLKDFYCPALKRRIKSCGTSSCKHFSEVKRLRFCDYYFDRDKADYAIRLTQTRTPAELWIALYRIAYSGSSWKSYLLRKPDYLEKLQPVWRNESPIRMPAKALKEKAGLSAIRKAIKNSRARCVTVRLKAIPLDWSDERLKKISYLIYRIVNKYTLIFIIERKKVTEFKNAVGVELEIKGDYFTE